MIEVRNLTKKYGDRVAVDNISFSVKKGEILGFLGQNGAGKSTTMKILTCFMPSTEGTASIAGHDVFENAFEVKKRIGYLPENPPLYTELLVREYLSFIADLRRIPRKDKKKAIERAIEQTQLGDVRNRLIGNLSKGYKQRVGLAQALIHEPEVLILDEPTVGLDPKQVAEARHLIRSLGSNRTVIFSTHILSEVAATCSRIIVIDRGEIVAQEALSSLGNTNARLTEIVVRKLPEPIITKLKSIEGVTNVSTTSNGTNRIVVESNGSEEVMSRVAKMVVDADLGLIRMSPKQLALEDYYLDLIAGKRSAT